MQRLNRLLAALTISSAFPAMALAQTPASDHAPGQAAVGTEGAQANPHGQQPNPHGTNPAPVDHQADCNCCCCQMMRQMMMQMHGAHQQGTAPAGQTGEHQRHEMPRPN